MYIKTEPIKVALIVITSHGLLALYYTDTAAP